MKTLVTVFIFSIVFYTSSEPRLDSKEAKAAFEHLNNIRKDPEKLAKSLPFLKGLKPTVALKWNDTLAGVAETKALDMARRNYFAHVDPEGYGMNYYINKAGYRLRDAWLKKPTANFFESCNAGGPSGRQVIEMLLIDSGVVDLGHRKHLMGLDSWSSTLYDIGIGFARRDSGSFYRTYSCIIIAKH